MPRRRMRSSNVGPVIFNSNGSEEFMKHKFILYLDRLLARCINLDKELLDLVHWLLGAAEVDKFIETLRPLFRTHGIEVFIKEDMHDAYDFSNALLQLLSIDRRSMEHKLNLLVRESLKRISDSLPQDQNCQFAQGFSLLKEMFRLSDIETEICILFSLLHIWEEPERYFLYRLRIQKMCGRNYLGAVLNVSEPELVRSINGKLTRIGIIESDNAREISLEQGFYELLSSVTDGDLKTEFFKKVYHDPIDLSLHTVEPKLTQHLITLLSRKTATSTHILLYGPPGTGKTSYALGIAKELGLPAYVVEHSQREWRRKQFSITASVNAAAHLEDAIVIADDVDIALATRNSWVMFGESTDKRWLHDILEIPGIRMIWIVNSISQIEESVARRFTFSMGFKPFSTAQRITLWQNILGQHNLSNVLTAHQVKELAVNFQSTPGIIEQAVRKASEMGCCSEQDLITSLTLSLEAHETLKTGGQKPTKRKSTGQKTIIECLNVGGANLKDLVDELSLYNDGLRSGTSELGSMALLFHGASGTGKSHFAQYIAEILDKEIVLKRGSDLLSMWVGETEKNIRAAYEEAEVKDAILIFDEADSLIFTRERASRSWELSFTNEFLNWMEEFRGIQIFTTNRLSDMDAASLRRFNYKVEFQYLKPEGSVIFYQKLLLPLVNTRFTRSIESELMGIKHLSPGDFRVVRDKFRLKKAGSFSHSDLLTALKNESAIKSMHAGEKVIGF